MTAVACAVIIFVVRAVFQQRKLIILWVIPLLIAAAGVGLDRLVETDTEKIKNVIRTIIRAAEKENTDAIENLIDDDYRDGRHENKSQLVGHCRASLSEPVVEKMVSRILDIQQQPANASVITTLRVVFEDSSYVAQTYKKDVFVKVRFTLKKQADQRWLVTKIEILEIDRQPAAWIDLRAV
jgi:hypothetical protein